MKKLSINELIDYYHIPKTSGSLLISLEGIEGSGKSTQIKELENYFTSIGMRTLSLREPGGTVFGEKLREAILGGKTPLDPMAECHLFLASRAQLIKEKIIPFLDQSGSVVILDRYIDSTLAYQGKARKLGLETILDLHKYAPLNLLPHRTYFLDISLELSMKRQNERGFEKDYFESEKKEFYQNLVTGYQEVSQLFQDRILRIDGTKPAGEITKLILNDVKKINYEK